MPILLFLLLLLPAGSGQAADAPLSFADRLAAEGDHYRAITEYKRFLHFHPQDPAVPRALLGIARSLHAGERWAELDPALERVWQLAPGSPEALAARELYAAAAYDRGDFAEARRRYQQLQEILGAAAPPLAAARIGLSYLAENRIDEAAESFARLDRATAPELPQALADYRQLPRKSPLLAGTLSALLPGAGQLYTGRPRQAAVALALNAAFIYGAIEAWHNDNHAVAGILALFEIGWYGGNVVNALNNAHKFNRRLEEDARQRLEKGLKLGLRWQKGTPILSARLRF